MAERARRYQRTLREGAGLTDLARRFVDAYGATVLRGPFAGLAYPRELVMAQTDAPIAKLLGTYEQELHPVFEEVIAQQPQTIVDIGAADGYYAVGLALTCPGSAVYAFEPARSGRESCRALAGANRVKVNLRGNATARRIQALRLDGAFVLCDIEGTEASVLDQATADGMRTTTVMVELHEREVSGITDVLRMRFSEHDCTIIHGHPRNPNLSELVAEFPPDARELAVTEWRGYPARWAVFRPRAYALASQGSLGSSLPARRSFIVGWETHTPHP
jgi:hypothetical protein